MGKGLGNRFLDDLRHADALVHVVDVSGTTDAEGMFAFWKGESGGQYYGGA
jgi:ribosome-binding ATPase YchF (GTP1/OBG family)